MPLTLSPEAEARVRAVADRSGLPADVMLSDLLEAALQEQEQEFQETVAGIQAGMDDYAAGRWTSLEDWRIEMVTKRQAWNKAEGTV